MHIFMQTPGFLKTQFKTMFKMKVIKVFERIEINSGLFKNKMMDCDGWEEDATETKTIMDNPHHPLHETAGALSSSFSQSLKHRRCRKKHFGGFSLLSAIRLQQRRHYYLMCYLSSAAFYQEMVPNQFPRYGINKVLFYFILMWSFS